MCLLLLSSAYVLKVAYITNNIDVFVCMKKTLSEGTLVYAADVKKTIFSGKKR